MHMPLNFEAKVLKLSGLVLGHKLYVLARVKGIFEDILHAFV